MRHPVLTALLFLSPIAAQAGESVWQNVAPNVDVRLISAGELAPDGTMLVGLEIDMPHTTKTYWRVPGETGIPTVLDLTASTGVTAHNILWPYPTIDTAGGYDDYVYYGPTVLPLHVNLADTSAILALTFTLGICEDVCVPVHTELSLSLEKSPDPANALRLRQAAAMAPLPWDGPHAAFGAVHFDAARKSVIIEITDPQIDAASVIGAIGRGDPLLGAAELDRATGSVVLPVLGKADPAELIGQTLDLVFMTRRGAFSLSQTIAP